MHLAMNFDRIVSAWCKETIKSKHSIDGIMENALERYTNFYCLTVSRKNLDKINFVYTFCSGCILIIKNK